MGTIITMLVAALIIEAAFAWFAIRSLLEQQSQLLDRLASIDYGAERMARAAALARPAVKKPEPKPAKDPHPVLGGNY